jgi:hypothetical protein
METINAGTLPDSGVLQGSTTARTGLSVAAIDTKRLAKIAGLASAVYKIAHAGAARRDGVANDLFNGMGKPLVTPSRNPVYAAGRVDACFMK